MIDDLVARLPPGEVSNLERSTPVTVFPTRASFKETGGASSGSAQATRRSGKRAAPIVRPANSKGAARKRTKVNV